LKTEKILTRDDNAWVGFPTALTTEEELQEPLSRLEVDLKSSPLAFKTKRAEKHRQNGCKFDPFVEEIRRRQKLRIRERNNMSKQPQQLQAMDSQAQIYRSHDEIKQSPSYTSNSGNWSQKFKRLYVTPIRGAKPLPFTHKVAVESVYKGKLTETDPTPLQTQSIGATTRKLLKCIESNNVSAEFPIEETSVLMKLNSVSHLSSFAVNKDKRKRLSNIIDLEVSSTINCALSTLPVSLVDHAMVKVNEEKLKHKESLPVYDALWHKEFDRKGEFIGYVRRDTQERWVVYYDDFGTQYFVNSVTSESSWTAPQNSPNGNLHDNDEVLKITDHNTEKLQSPDLSQCEESIASTLKPTKSTENSANKVKARQFKEALKPFLEDSVSTIGSLARGKKMPDGSFHFETSNIHPPMGEIYLKNASRVNQHLNDSWTSEEELENVRAFDNLQADVNAKKTSPWVRLKEATLHLLQQASTFDRTEKNDSLNLNIPMKKKKEIKSKARVWYVRPKGRFELRYTWLPQPLIGKAAAHIKGHDMNTNFVARSSENSMVSSLAKSESDEISHFDCSTIATQAIEDISYLSLDKKKKPRVGMSTFSGFMSKFISSKTKSMRKRGEIHSSKFIL